MRLVLDAGALIAIEKPENSFRIQLKAAQKLGVEVITTSPVVAQVWRGGRQANLARLLTAIRIDAPDETAARRAGELLAKARTRDVVDALVVGLTANDDTIVTSDPDDIRHLVVAAGLAVHIVRP